MRLPDFNADAAVGRASRTYRGTYQYGIGAQGNGGSPAFALPVTPEYIAEGMADGDDEAAPDEGMDDLGDMSDADGGDDDGDGMDDEGGDDGADEGDDDSDGD